MSTSFTRQMKQVLSAYLFANGFFSFKQGIQRTLSDGLQQRSRDIHVRVERVLPRRELRKSGDGRFEMSCIASEVTGSTTVLVVKNLHACCKAGTHICETSFTSLTPVLLVISAASALYLEARIWDDNKLRGTYVTSFQQALTLRARHLLLRQRSGTAVQHVSPRRNPWYRSRRTFSASCHSPGRSGAAMGLAHQQRGKRPGSYLDGHAVQFHLENVMYKCLVCP